MLFVNSLKVLVSLRGLHPARAHSVHTHIDQAQPLPTAIHEALAPFKTNTIRPEENHYDDISCWRVGGTYPADLPEATADLIHRLGAQLTPTAVAVADTTIAELVEQGADQADDNITKCRKSIIRAFELLSARQALTQIFQLWGLCWGVCSREVPAWCGSIRRVRRF